MADIQLRELAHREANNGDLQVTLAWDQYVDEVVLIVTDERTHRAEAVRVPKEDAMCAFHHPFAYIG